MSTPGHGGRDCAFPSYWKYIALKPSETGACAVVDRVTENHILHVWYCPACGDMLTPDVPKLAPCPACGGEAEMDSTLGGYGVCLDDACMVSGPSNDPTGEKWNKAFGAKRGIDKEGLANRIFHAFQTHNYPNIEWLVGMLAEEEGEG